MQDVIADVQKLSDRNRAPQGNSKSAKRYLLWLLLLLGLGGGGMMIVPRALVWNANYQCSKENVAGKRPEAAYQCLERFSGRAARFFTLLGFDLRIQYLSVINEELEARQFQQALEACLSARQKFSWEPAFVGNQALALFGLGKHQEAMKVLEEFLNSPQLAKLDSKMRAQIDLIAVQVYLGAQNIQKAEEYLQKVLAQDAENPTAHLLYARLEAFRGNPEAMASHYEKAFAGDPKNLVWQDLFLLALQDLNTGKIEQFQEIFARSRRDFPNASGFHLLLAMKFLKEGNYASAYYEVLFEKEVGLADAGYFTQAIQAIEKEFARAFEKRPAEPWLFPVFQFIHGKQAYEAGDFPRAHAWFQQSLQNEEHPLQSLYLGRALAGMGEVDSAIGYYGKTLNKQETFALATAEMAGLYLKKGIQEAAVNLWQKALSIDPSIEKFSDTGKELAKLQAAAKPAEISETYKQKLSDNLMKAQLNQMILNAFSGVLSPGV